MVNDSSFRVRRATVDDLPAMLELWRVALTPSERLEKEFTDFQLAEDAAGRLHAAIGLQISGSSGWVHSETIGDFALADTLRPLLWARVLSVAQNHGLFRLWTLETAPFWKKEVGFAPPPEEVKQKFPEAFGSLDEPWLALRLRDEGADPDAIERQFAAFKEAERLKREKLIGQVRPLKWIGTAIAAILFLIGLAALLHVLLQSRRR